MNPALLPWSYPTSEDKRISHLREVRDKEDLVATDREDLENPELKYSFVQIAPSLLYVKKKGNRCLVLIIVTLPRSQVGSGIFTIFSTLIEGLIEHLVVSPGVYKGRMYKR